MKTSHDIEQFDAVERLQAVRDLVALYATDDVAEWFCEGVDQWFLADGALGDCLGLSSARTVHHLATRYWVYKRNQHIRQAARLLLPCNDVTRLILELEKFRKSWVGLAMLTGPDRHWSGLKTELFWAFKYGESAKKQPPKSRKQLNDIISAGCDTDVTPLQNFLYNK